MKSDIQHRTNWLSRGLAAFVALALTASARAQPEPLPPDLQPLSSYLSGWSVANLGGNARELRIPVGTANAGWGALHLIGGTIHPPLPNGSQKRDVMQRIFQVGGMFSDRLVGVFVHHPADTNFHVEGWAAYRLRVRTAGNGLGPILMETDQTSSCVIDANHYNAALPGSPANAEFFSCGLTQGVSVGWNDVIASNASGQSLSITGVPNGDYWLEHEADPWRAIEELNETNNLARIPITLTSQPAVTGLRAIMSSPLGGLSGIVSFVDFTFNQPINAATFTVADVSFIGPSGAIAATSVSTISAVTFRVNFPAQAATGAYTMVIGPNIAGSSGPAAMDQNNNGVAGEAADVGANAFTLLSSCAADIASPHNGSVDVGDLLAVITSWGACAAPCPPNCAADIVPDCTVNVSDLLAVITHWGACL